MKHDSKPMPFVSIVRSMYEGMIEMGITLRKTREDVAQVLALRRGTAWPTWALLAAIWLTLLYSTFGDPHGATTAAEQANHARRPGHGTIGLQASGPDGSGPQDVGPERRSYGRDPRVGGSVGGESDRAVCGSDRVRASGNAQERTSEGSAFRPGGVREAFGPIRFDGAETAHGGRGLAGRADASILAYGGWDYLHRDSARESRGLFRTVALSPAYATLDVIDRALAWIEEHPTTIGLLSPWLLYVVTAIIVWLKKPKTQEDYQRVTGKVAAVWKILGALGPDVYKARQAVQEFKHGYVPRDERVTLPDGLPAVQPKDGRGDA